MKPNEIMELKSQFAIQKTSFLISLSFVSPFAWNITSWNRLHIFVRFEELFARISIEIHFIF